MFFELWTITTTLYSFVITYLIRTLKTAFVSKFNVRETLFTIMWNTQTCNYDAIYSPKEWLVWISATCKNLLVFVNECFVVQGDIYLRISLSLVMLSTVTWLVEDSVPATKSVSWGVSGVVVSSGWSLPSDWLKINYRGFTPQLMCDFDANYNKVFRIFHLINTCSHSQIIVSILSNAREF